MAPVTPSGRRQNDLPFERFFAIYVRGKKVVVGCCGGIGQLPVLRKFTEKFVLEGGYAIRGRKICEFRENGE